MATASVYTLTERHDEAQRRHVAAAEAMFARLCFFPDAGPLPLARVTPSEGWLDTRAYAWTSDPMGTLRMGHDVVPDGGRTTRAHAARIGSALRDAVAATGMPGPPHAPRPERYFRADDMELNIVNIVHTSYFYKPRAPDDAVLIPQRFVCRRLMTMGLHTNKVHASSKICLIAPFNASKILFPPGRVLETGANNMDMAYLTLAHVILPYLHAAGLTDLRIKTREAQNIVTTSALPGGRRIDLVALKKCYPDDDMVAYEPANFAGAIIHLERMPAPFYIPDVSLLVFSAGAVVSVGGSSIASTLQAHTVGKALLTPHSYASAKRKRVEDT
jgi:TATA-box binding protein (TBP) (component of TFIID and TFIIIB)